MCEGKVEALRWVNKTVREGAGVAIQTVYDDQLGPPRKAVTAPYTIYCS